MLIFLSNQFVRYLGRAAAGKISSEILLQIVVLQIPYLLGLLLPVGLFLGILLAYGRLYVESEMTVLSACGFSRKALLAVTLKCALLVAVLVGILTLYVSPELVAYVNRLKSSTQANILLQTIVPGRFQVSPDGRLVYYIEKVSKDRKTAYNIFVAQQEKVKPDSTQVAWRVTRAQEGYQTLNTLTHEPFIVAKEGYQYVGIPGQKEFNIIEFLRYGIKIPEQEETGILRKTEWSGMSSQALWTNRQDLDALAELEWRVAIPLSVPVLAFLAVPLSRVPPRRGRFAQLLPAILVYTVFANMMFVTRDWIEEGIIPGWIGFGWLHISLIILAIFLMMNKRAWATKFNYLNLFSRNRYASSKQGGA